MPGSGNMKVSYAHGSAIAVGTTLQPTYHNLGDHTEAVQLEFDPEIISYGELLDLFWQYHHPIYKAPQQYMSLILYSNQDQKKEAYESLVARADEWNTRIYTEIRPGGDFYPAEDYHQKYYLQQKQALMEELRTIYPDFQSLIDSTLTARLNAYLVGYGSITNIAHLVATLEIELGDYSPLRAITGSCPY